MTENTPPLSPLIGNTVNPLTLQNSEYKVPELPNAGIYKGPDTSVSKEDIAKIQSQPKTVFADKIKGLVKKLDDAPKWAGDLTPYGKVVSYDADYTGANFQRYYNHSKFKDLGFSPFRDNESLYNQIGSWADDAGRMMRGWSSLFATGAMDGVKSWADDPFSPEADTDTAREMERKMSTMTSSKGGFGGGVINFGANTAYSMGLVTEFMAETAALTVATAVTFGADAPVTITAEAARAATLSSKLANAGKMMSNTYKTLTSLKDLSTAKNFFKSVNSGEILGKALNFINPLENTAAFIKDTNKAMKSGEQVYNLAKAAKGFGAFINDVRQTQMVMSEANLEGGSVKNDMVKQLTDDFYKEHNRMPDTNEASDIYNVAGIAGSKTIAWNMPALYLSNKIVFENAFKGFKPMRVLAAENSEGLAGKLSFNQAWKKAGVNPWSVVEEGWKNNLKSLTKASTWAPKNLAKDLLSKGLGYTSKNLTEALQEQYQEAVSGAMKQYYTGIYQDPSKAGSDEMGSIFSDNLSQQFTTMQGFETFASGFFMGGVLQGPQKLVFESIPKKIFQMRNPAEFAEREAKKKEYTSKVLESLNEVTKDPAMFFNTASENMVVQRNTNKGMNEANENNNEKAFRDIADESVFNHLHTIINSGKYELILGHLKDMKQLSAEDLQNAFGPVPHNADKSSYYNNKIDSLIDRAENIKKRSDIVNEQFNNPFNPYKYNKGTENELYTGEYMRWQAYEDAKKAAVYSHHSFDRTLSRMSDIVNSVSSDIPISKANSTNFTLLFDSKAIDNEIGSLDVEVNAYTSGTAQQRQQAKQALNKKEALEQLRDNINHYRTGLSEDNNPQKVTERNQATTIKSGSKVKNIKDGSEGVVDKVVGKYAILKDGKKVNRKYLESKNKNVEPGHHLDDALEMLHSSYKNYLKTIADITKDHVFDDKVDESFSKLKDYYALENDSSNLANSINLLHNPSSFIDYSKQMESVRKSLYENRVQHMKKALDEYMKIKDQNELLNKLLEDGVYIHPDDVKALLNDKVIPGKLFDVINYEELQPSSEKYQKGLASINHWIEAVTQDKPSNTIESVRSQLGNESNKQLFDEFISIINNTKNGLSSDDVNILLKGLTNEGVAIVGGTTDPARNIEARGDIDTAWLTLPKTLSGSEQQQYYTALDKLTSTLSTSSSRQQPMLEDDAIEADKYNQSANTKSNPIFIGDIIKDLLSNIQKTTINVDVNTPEPITENTKINNTTPINEMPSDLVDELVEAFKGENRTKIANGEDPIGNYKITDDNYSIISQPGFKSYVTLFSKPRSIISSYNTKTGRTIEQVVPETKKEQKIAQVSRIITTDMRQQLSDLGYVKEDIDKMRPAQANHLISGNITKPKVEEKSTEQEIDLSGLKVIENLFKDANTLEDIEQAEEEVLATLADPESRRKIGLTNEFLVKLIEARKKELLTTFTYEDINVGDVVVMSNNDKMLVVQKSDIGLKLRKFGDEGDNYTNVKKDIVPSTIKYKYKEGMEDVNINNPITEEEKQISDQSVKNFVEFNEDDDADTVEEDMKKATSMSPQDRNDDLTNNLGCK